MVEGFHVLTGAPGTGKSTLLRHLASTVSVVHEPARRVLAEWRAGGNPLPSRIDPDLMVERLVATTVSDHSAATGTVVFDRGAIDAVAYARYMGCDDARALEVARTVRFGGGSFLLTPWQKIYTPDEERVMTFEQVLRFHEVLLGTYAEFGVELVEVPQGTVSERARFVLDRI